MRPDASPSVLVADRHPGLSEGLRSILKARFDVVVLASDEASLIDCARRLRPVLVVVDISLERKGSLAWLTRLRAECPEAKIIVIGLYEASLVARTVIAAGADDYVSKRAVVSELIPAAEAALSIS
jgi:DNA-binding NarL/FixJ family response regulator